MNTAVSSGRLPQGSRSTKAHHELMQLLWQRLSQVFGPSIWDVAGGPVDGETFTTWSKALEAYNREQVARGLQACKDWPFTEVPTVKQFCELCLTETHKPRTQEPPAEQKTSSVKEREMARQQQIKNSPKSRTAHPDDVETFMEAYHNLRLGARWPGGEVVL